MSGLFRKGALSVLARSVTMLALLGVVIAGCGGEKPPVKDPEQVKMEEATSLVTKAEAALKKGDLDEAEKLAKQAQKVKDIAAAKDLLAKIQKQRTDIGAADRQKKIDSLLAEAKKKMDAKDYDGAIAKANEVLKIDAASPAAVELKAKAQAAKKPAGPDPKAEYAKISKQVDAAKNNRDYDKAKDLIRKLEQHVPAGGPSRQGEVAEIDAEKLLAQGAKIEAAARDLNGFRDAKGKYEAALKKKDMAKIRERLAGVQKKISAIETEAAAAKRARQAIMRAKELERAGELASALHLLRTAGREARSNATLQRQIRESMVRINTELGYRTSVDAGDQAMVRGDYARAVSEYRKAQRIKDTPQVRTKIQEAEAVNAEAAGTAALAAGNLSEAIAKFQQAIQLRPTAELAGKLEAAKAKKARQDYLAEVKKAETARANKQFRTVAASLKVLDGKYPDWKEAGDLLAKGALPEEKKMIDAQALKAWKALLATTKKLGANSSRKIAAIEAALPGLAGSRYEAMAERNLKTEKDKLARAKHTKLMASVKKQKTGQAKVAMLEAALPGFKGTSFADRIAKAIKTEKDTMARSKHKALKAAVAKMKTPTAKIKALEAALPGFAGTSFADTIKKDVMREKDTLARPKHTKLMASVNKLKTPKDKLAKLQAAVGGFEGTSFKAQIETAIKREIDNIKRGQFTALNASLRKAKTPREKIAKIEAAMPNFKGSSFEKQLSSMLSREKNTLKTAEYKALLGQIKSHQSSQLKIAELTRRLPDFKGTRYEATLKKMIASEKTKQVVGKYKALTAAVAKEKDPQKKIARLEAAQATFKGTRYEKTVAGMLTKAKTNLKRDMFNKLNGDVRKMKSAKAKVAKLEMELPKYKGTTFDKQIQGMIKTEKGKIAAEEKAAKAAAAKVAAAKKDAAAKKVYDATMAKVKKSKDAAANIKMLADAKNKVAGTKYQKLVQNELKRQEAAKKKADAAAAKKKKGSSKKK